MAGNIEGRSDKLDINKASKEDLMKIKGVSDTLANKIIQYRDQHGGFKAAEELDDIEGFAETRKDELLGAVKFD